MVAKETQMAALVTSIKDTQMEDVKDEDTQGVNTWKDLEDKGMQTEEKDHQP